MAAKLAGWQGRGAAFLGIVWGKHIHIVRASLQLGPHWPLGDASCLPSPASGSGGVGGEGTKLDPGQAVGRRGTFQTDISMSPRLFPFRRLGD